jgi:hypothetical protein
MAVLGRGELGATLGVGITGWICMPRPLRVDDLINPCRTDPVRLKDIGDLTSTRSRRRIGGGHGRPIEIHPRKLLAVPNLREHRARRLDDLTLGGLLAEHQALLDEDEEVSGAFGQTIDFRRDLECISHNARRVC